MAQTCIDFERSVAETIGKLDYVVMTDLSRLPGASSEQKQVATAVRQSPHLMSLPSLIVAKGDSAALVEPKLYSVQFAAITQARHYADYFRTPVIICVPDEAYLQIPASVREWADEIGVELTTPSRIGFVLKKILEPTEGPDDTHEALCDPSR